MKGTTRISPASKNGAKPATSSESEKGAVISPKPKHRASDGLGPIVADAVYPLELFRRLSGLDQEAVKQAKKKGLRIVICGRRGFIIGADFLQFVRTLQDRTEAASDTTMDAVPRMAG